MADKLPTPHLHNAHKYATGGQVERTPMMAHKGKQQQDEATTRHMPNAAQSITTGRTRREHTRGPCTAYRRWYREVGAAGPQHSTQQTTPQPTTTAHRNGKASTHSSHHLIAIRRERAVHSKAKSRAHTGKERRMGGRGKRRRRRGRGIARRGRASMRESRKRSTGSGRSRSAVAASTALFRRPASFPTTTTTTAARTRRRRRRLRQHRIT